MDRSVQDIARSTRHGWRSSKFFSPQKFLSCPVLSTSWFLSCSMQQRGVDDQRWCLWFIKTERRGGGGGGGRPSIDMLKRQTDSTMAREREEEEEEEEWQGASWRSL